MHIIELSISTSKWFESQQEMARWLGIKGTSKRAIASRCRSFGYAVLFDDYFGDHNVKQLW